MQLLRINKTSERMKINYLPMMMITQKTIVKLTNAKTVVIIAVVTMLEMKKKMSAISVKLGTRFRHRVNIPEY
jgi:hypothetical protein